MVSTEQACITELSELDLQRMHGILQHAYAVTEVEIWGENYSRMSLEEFISLVKKGEIILAKINNETVGSIHVYPLSKDVYAFGLLSADFTKKGLGIGRSLISAAEEFAKNNEILKPRDFEVPVKLILHDWYERLGYTYITSMLFEERKPNKTEKAKQLKVPSVFDCYEKSLQ